MRMEEEEEEEVGGGRSKRRRGNKGRDNDTILINPWFLGVFLPSTFSTRSLRKKPPATSTAMSIRKEKMARKML